MNSIAQLDDQALALDTTSGITADERATTETLDDAVLNQIGGGSGVYSW